MGLRRPEFRYPASPTNSQRGFAYYIGYCLTVTAYFPFVIYTPFPIPLELSQFTFTYTCKLIIYPFIHRWLPLQCRLRQFWNGITRQNPLTTTYRSLKLFRLSLKKTFDLPKNWITHTGDAQKTSCQCFLRQYKKKQQYHEFSLLPQKGKNFTR